MTATPRDGYGRYLIQPPGGGKATGYTRATTIAKALDDTHNLTQWKIRQTAIGLTQRPDLHALIASTDPTDKKTLDRHCADALEAAGASTGANAGTALHAATETLDLGIPIEMPEPYKTDLTVYVETMRANNIEIHKDLIEKIVVLDGPKIAGTFDRIVTLPTGETVIADLKTSQNLDWSWNSIAVQLAIYANADDIYNPETGWRQPLPPELDKTRALVIHLPSGQARCELHLVDIQQGWEALQLALQVRAWRQTRKLNTPYSYQPTTRAPDGKRAAVTERIEHIRTHGAIAQLAAAWPAHIPTLKQSDNHTLEELAEICKTLDHIEQAAGLPF